MRTEGVLAYLRFTCARPLIDAGEMAEIKMRPEVIIEPLGLLRPSAELSEAVESVIRYLQERSSRPARSKRASIRAETGKRLRRDLNAARHSGEVRGD